MKERQLIDIDHLIVDEENPRFEAVSTEEDALFSILEDQTVASGNKVLNLARDIAANGLNASELLIVSPIEGTNNYRVREGNRRVTAIKLSMHSDQIPDRFRNLTTQFEELADAMQQHRLIDCYVCDDEDEIRRLLILRHGGESGGIGTVKWNSAQTTRFSQAGNQQTARALSLVEHLREQYGQGELWHAAASIPATNLGRLISTPEVRQILNIRAVGNDAQYLGNHDDLLLDVFATIKTKGVGPIYGKDDRMRLVDEAARRIEPDRFGQSQLSLGKTGVGASDAEPSGLLGGSVSSQDQDCRSLSSDETSDAGIDSSDETPAHPQNEGSIPVTTSTNSNGSIVPSDEPANNPRPFEPVRKKPVSRNASKKMFGCPLRPRGTKSNDLYRAIDWIDQQYLTNPDANNHLLPILGFSLRLLMETIAREYYESQDSKPTQSPFSAFMKSVAKPALKEKIDSSRQNYLALASEWINGDISFEALFHMWAHGTVPVDRASLVRQSEFVAIIIKEVWSDGGARR